MDKLVIIDYDTGNVQSLKYALNRLGVDPILSRDAEQIRSAEKVILPGVGAARPAMEALSSYGLDKLVSELKQPVMGVCLGTQIMCNYSEEGHTECLGIFDLPVLKFEEKEKVPHMGWNAIENIDNQLFRNLEEGSFTYFVHSYYVPESDFTIARTNYMIPFSAAIGRDNFYACQFHPEKSGDVGSKILENFMEL